LLHKLPYLRLKKKRNNILKINKALCLFALTICFITSPIHPAAADKTNVELVAAQEITNTEALHNAARTGDIATVQSHMEAKIDRELTEKLHQAINEGHFDVVNTMLNSKINIESRNHSIDPTPLMTAADSGYLYNRNDSLHSNETPGTASKAMMELLLQHKADPNAIADDRTPLRAAIRIGNKPGVELLLDAKADASHVCKFSLPRGTETLLGWTAYIQVTSKIYLSYPYSNEIIPLLLRAGASFYDARSRLWNGDAIDALEVGYANYLQAQATQPATTVVAAMATPAVPKTVEKAP
jgi:ankyrin repeat protein